MAITIIKKNGSSERFTESKIIKAIQSAASRIGFQVPMKSLKQIIKDVKQEIVTDKIDVFDVHTLVCRVLSRHYPDVAASYQNFRDYKLTYARDFDKLFKQSEDVILLGDRENANFDSALISTKGSLIRGYTTSMLYKRFYLHKDESEAIRRGDIYVHDIRDQMMGSYNCIDGNGWVTIKIEDEIKTLTLDSLREYLGLREGVFKLNGNVQVLSRNGWVKLRVLSARHMNEGEDLYSFKTKNGLGITVTGKHRIPVVDQSGNEVVKFAEDITTNDHLLSFDGDVGTNDDFIDLCDYVNPNDTYVGGLQYLKRYVEYKFDLSLQQYCKDNQIEASKNLYGMKVSDFNKLKSLLTIPYNVYNKLHLKKRGAKKNIPLLLPINEELARMFGYIFSDGHVSNGNNGNYHLVFSNTDRDLIDDFIKCVNIVFPNVSVCSYEPNTTVCANVVMSNGVIWDLFKKYKTNSNNITIPDFIIHGSDNIVNAFLAAAWDGDGYFSGDGRLAGYTTCCKEYSDQIVLALQRLGYNPTIVSLPTTGQQYHFGDVVGIKNYDTHTVKLEKIEEVRKFSETTSSFKSRFFTLKERSSVCGFHNRITKITKLSGNTDKFVYDLTTGDSWVLVNNYVVHNCSLFDIENVLSHGFEMSNIKYREPSSVLSALCVIGDITLVSTAQQFGGFTLAELDRILVPYCKKTMEKAYKEYDQFVEQPNKEKREKFAWDRLTRELTQGFQGLELKLNTVPCSRGDFAFTTISFAAIPPEASEEDKKIQRYICEIILKTRKQGHNGIPVVFPKLVYLYSKEQHKDPLQQQLFDKALACSAETMYPDYLSIDSDYGAVSKLYRETGAITSPMG